MNNEEPQGGSAAVATAPESNTGTETLNPTATADVNAALTNAGAETLGAQPPAAEMPKPADPLSTLSPFGTPTPEALNATHADRQEKKGNFISRFFSKANPVQVSYEQKTPDHLATGQTPPVPNVSTEAQAAVNNPDIKPPSTEMESVKEETPAPSILDQAGEVAAQAEAKDGSLPTDGAQPPAVETTSSATSTETSGPETLSQQMETVGENPAEIPVAPEATAQIPTTEPAQPTLPTSPEASAPLSSGDILTSQATTETDSTSTSPVATEPTSAVVSEPTAPVQPAAEATTEEPQVPAFSADALADKPTTEAQTSGSEPTTSVTEPASATTSLSQDMETAGEHPAEANAPLGLETTMPPTAPEDANKWMVGPTAEASPAATTPSSETPTTTPESPAPVIDPLAVPTSLSQDMDTAGEHPAQLDVQEGAQSTLPTTEPVSTAGLPTPGASTAPLSSGEIVPPTPPAETPTSEPLAPDPLTVGAMGATLPEVTPTTSAEPAPLNATAENDINTAAINAWNKPITPESSTSTTGSVIDQAASVAAGAEVTGGALPAANETATSEAKQDEQVAVGGGTQTQ